MRGLSAHQLIQVPFLGGHFRTRVRHISVGKIARAVALPRTRFWAEQEQKAVRMNIV